MNFALYKAFIWDHTHHSGTSNNVFKVSRRRLFFQVFPGFLRFILLTAGRFRPRGAAQTPIVKGLITFSCIDLLALHVGYIPARETVWGLEYLQLWLECEATVAGCRRGCCKTPYHPLRSIIQREIHRGTIVCPQNADLLKMQMFFVRPGALQNIWGDANFIILVCLNNVTQFQCRLDDFKAA